MALVGLANLASQRFTTLRISQRALPLTRSNTGLAYEQVDLPACDTY